MCIRARNNHVQVSINIFGREKTDHIDVDRIRRIVAGATGGAKDVLVQVARAIYLERPENRTAFLPNVKDNRARVRVAGGWEERSGTEVAKAMHERASDEVYDKQPMASRKDTDLMDPVLRALQGQEAPMAELRALLVNMRPPK